MTLDAQQLAGFQMGDALLAALIVMLLVEQLLAYMASYHVPPLRGAPPDDPRSVFNLLLFAQAAATPAPQAAPTRSITQPATERSRLRTLPASQRSTTSGCRSRSSPRPSIALVAVVWYFYRRDTVELPRPRGSASLLLRFVALAGLLVFFLGIERRTTREVVHNSQVAVLVDVSQSMGLSEDDERDRQPAARASTPSSTRSPTARWSPICGKRTT